jgi:hypothetical protein
MRGLKIFGLIDTDFRSKKQISSLKKEGIYCLPFSEIENVFLIPEIIEIVCTHLKYSDKKDEIINEIRNNYKENIETVKFRMIQNNIRFLMCETFDKIMNKQEYDDYKASIFERADKIFTNINIPNPDSSELIKILKIYPHKGLVRKIQNKIKLSRDDYIRLIFNFITSDEKNAVLNILRKYLPDIKV